MVQGPSCALWGGASMRRTAFPGTPRGVTRQMRDESRSPTVRASVWRAALQPPEDTHSPARRLAVHHGPAALPPWHSARLPRGYPPLASPRLDPGVLKRRPLLLGDYPPTSSLPIPPVLTEHEPSATLTTFYNDDQRDTDLQHCR